MMRWLLLGVTAVTLLVSCGRYGPPVRAPRPAPEAAPAAQPAAETGGSPEDESEEEEAR